MQGNDKNKGIFLFCRILIGFLGKNKQVAINWMIQIFQKIIGKK